MLFGTIHLEARATVYWDNPVSNGRHGTVGALAFCFVDELSHHSVHDYDLPVGDAFIFGEGCEYDCDVVLLRIKQIFSTLEQLVSWGEVFDHHLVLDGGAKDHLALDEGDCIASNEIVPGFIGLVRHAWTWQLHTMSEL